MKSIQSVLTISGLFVLVLILNSCASAYVPNKVNSPLLSNKGELQLSVNAGVSGFDPQFAYAITDHLGVMANGSFDYRVSDSTENFHVHQFLEVAPGYYTSFARIMRFEVYGGFGMGSTQGQYDNQLWISNADARLVRAFVQPGIGLTTNFADLSLVTRFSYVALSQDDQFSGSLFLEPVLDLKLGYKYVKLISQVGFSLPLGDESVDFAWQPIIFSVGLQVDLFKN
ncbi:MAG: hypothetical protein JW801_15055 [Bacteroidales bacterium]|nr:hypothetical protein [Bacteroidales bacterium]